MGDLGCGCGQPGPSGCDNQCGSTKVDLGCGCDQPGPSGCDNQCGSTKVDLGCGCGQPGPSGCDNQCGSTAVDLGCGCGNDCTSCSYSERRNRNCYNHRRITVEGFRGNDVTVETCQSLCSNHDDCVSINYYFNGICSTCGVNPSRCYLISSAANSGCRWGRGRVANTYTKGSCERVQQPTIAAKEETEQKLMAQTMTSEKSSASDVAVMGFALIGLVSIFSFA